MALDRINTAADATTNAAALRKISNDNQKVASQKNQELVNVSDTRVTDKSSKQNEANFNASKDSVLADASKRLETNAITDIATKVANFTKTALNEIFNSGSNQDAKVSNTNVQKQLDAQKSNDLGNIASTKQTTIAPKQQVNDQNSDQVKDVSKSLKEQQGQSTIDKAPEKVDTVKAQTSTQELSSKEAGTENKGKILTGDEAIKAAKEAKEKAERLQAQTNNVTQTTSSPQAQ